MTSSDWLALVGLVVSILGFGLAAVALERGNQNSSAALVVTMNDLFRQAWARYKAAKVGEDQDYEFHDLVNLIETAATIYYQKSFSGISKKLMEDYLREVLNLLDGSPELRARVANMRTHPGTFIHIDRFCSKFSIQLKDR